MLTTEHKILFADSRSLPGLSDETIELVVTSPPYPMIEMWDESFSKRSPKIKKCLSAEDGPAAFELMHEQLDDVWREMYRVLRPGCLAAINIGDATRTLKGHFRLYANHARILQSCTGLGFSALPMILWQKPTNAPNKFMGSGMLPGGAYVTLEHEYILLLRKGGKRTFAGSAEKGKRMSSCYFWEERNKWFSDIWNLKGMRQKLNGKGLRQRSAAFPFELPFRIINMYSLKGETVLDPFVGTGTTILAAMGSCRNSIGVEIDSRFKTINNCMGENVASQLNHRISRRLKAHHDFLSRKRESKNGLKYASKLYGFPVMTKQETGIQFNAIRRISHGGKNRLIVNYEEKAGDR